MPSKYDRSFEEGQPGKVYSLCYHEPKKGTWLAKNIDPKLSQNKPYQFKSRYPDLFENRDDSLLFASVDPLLDAIEEDLEEKSVDLCGEEKEILDTFLHQGWRQVIGLAIETDTKIVLNRGPYRLFQEYIFIKYSLIRMPREPNQFVPNPNNLINLMTPMYEYEEKHSSNIDLPNNPSNLPGYAMEEAAHFRDFDQNEELIAKLSLLPVALQSWESLAYSYGLILGFGRSEVPKEVQNEMLQSLDKLSKLSPESYEERNAYFK